MLPRALLVLLAVMNVAVALWWVAQSSSPSPAPDAAMPVGIPELRLLGEGATPAAAPAEPPQCYRFGPFSDPSILESARDAAAAFSGQVDVVTVPGPAPAAWRVVAPPPADGDSAALATRIVAAGFEDTLIVPEGSEAGSIALGRFSTQEAAERRRAALRDGGFDAQVHPVGGNTEWLHLPLRGEPDLLDMRAALAALQAREVACD